MTDNNNEGSVKFLRLNTGEDLIAYTYHIKEDDLEDEHYIIDTPLKIVYGTSPKMHQLMSISLMQWIFSRVTENHEFKLSAKDVLLCANASQHITEFYYETVQQIEELNNDIKNEEQSLKEQLSDDIDEEYIDEAESLELLQNLLESTKGKRTLH